MKSFSDKDIDARIDSLTEEGSLHLNHWIESLVQRYNKPLVRYTTGIVKDRETAKDVVQDCFLKALEYEPKQINVPAWLYRECRNRAIDIWRKARRVQPLAVDFDEKMAFSDATPQLHLETHQGIERMLKELDQLSPRQQEVIWLKYRDGLSYKEIAEVLNLTPNHVGVILYEAMKQLREAEAASTTDSRRRNYGE